MQSGIVRTRHAFTHACLLVLLATMVVTASPRKPAASAKGHPDLLYVFQYDGQRDWAELRTDAPFTASAVTWLLSLRDRLTMTSKRPLGDSLTVRLTRQTPKRTVKVCFDSLLSRSAH